MKWSGLTIFFVYSPMSLQGESIGKRSRTDVALERFQSRVHLFVIFKVSCLTECRLTSITLVGFLAGVDTPMVPESCVTGKSFIANFANVRLFAAVGSFVVFQMGRLRKLHATSSAFIRLLACVDSSMVFQIDCLGKRYPAHVALVVLFAGMELLVRP